MKSEVTTTSDNRIIAILNNLKPCPFCGSLANMYTASFGGENGPRFNIKCSECWCGTDWENFSEEEVAEKWNTRMKTE